MLMEEESFNCNERDLYLPGTLVMFNKLEEATKTTGTKRTTNLLVSVVNTHRNATCLLSSVCVVFHTSHLYNI